jgi:hypothetical protein
VFLIEHDVAEIVTHFRRTVLEKCASCVTSGLVGDECLSDQRNVVDVATNIGVAIGE